MRIKAVIFDHDGVIIKNRNTWKMLREEKVNDISNFLGLKIPFQEVKNLYGVYKLAESKGLMNFADFRYLDNALFRMVGLSCEDFKNVARKVEFRPGIKKLVKELYKNDITLGICSLAPRVCIDVTVKRLGYPFKYIFGTSVIFLNESYLGSFAYPPKNYTHPISMIENELDKAECIRYIRKKEKLKKEEILYVSDIDDSEITDYCLTVAYNSSDKKWVEKACLVTNNHKDILDYVLERK